MIGSIDEKEGTRPPAATRLRTANQAVLSLPREHGATVAFLLSALLSLRYSPEPAPLLFLNLSLAAVIGSTERPTQAMWIALLCAALLLAVGQFPLGCIVLAAGIGTQLFSDYKNSIEEGAKQTAGLLALAGAPMLAVWFQTGFSPTSIAAGVALVSSTLLSAAIVQLVINSPNITPVWALVGAALGFSGLSFWEPLLVGLCTIPFVVETIWLALANKPSFKRLGMVSATCLAISAIAIALVLK